MTSTSRSSALNTTLVLELARGAYIDRRENVIALTGAPLDRLTHLVHNLEINGQSYRLNQSRARHASAAD